MRNLLVWTRNSCSIGPVKVGSPYLRVARPCRSYASHRNMDFGERTQEVKDSLDTRRPTDPKHDHVGPFQLGLSQSSLRQGEKVPKWSELSAGGKVIRTTARTANVAIILLGAGLSALLIYSLSTELFSSNSPTKLYGDACQRIKRSKKISQHLNAPLAFHNNPPSSVRPRHRNRHVTSRVMLDAHGQEHMIMTFYVQGRPDGEQTISSDFSYTESATVWVREHSASLANLSFDEAVTWCKEAGHHAYDNSIRAFKYLSGSPLPPSPLPEIPADSQDIQKKESSSIWKFAGVFSSLKKTDTTSGDRVWSATERHFTDGEVHADLVKNKEGYFVFRYLLVDIPSTKDSNIRVFVEREPGVRENQPVMRWVS